MSDSLANTRIIEMLDAAQARSKVDPTANSAKEGAALTGAIFGALQFLLVSKAPGLMLSPQGETIRAMINMLVQLNPYVTQHPEDFFAAARATKADIQDITHGKSPN